VVDFQAGAWVEALIEGYLAALLAAGPGQAIRRVQQVKGSARSLPSWCGGGRSGIRDDNRGRAG